MNENSRNNTIKTIIESLLAEDEDSARKALKECIQTQYTNLLNEDHEKYMSSEEMETHLNKLFKMASKDEKEKFLEYLSKNANLETCTAKDFAACAETIQGKGKDEMDKVIHYLERLVGYDFDPKKLEEDLGNVKTAPSKGVPDDGADIPNVYKNKNTKKLKRKMHTLKKNVYGTGMQPAAAANAEVGGDVGGVGGDGGGGGE